MPTRRLRRVEVDHDELFSTVTDRRGCTFIGLYAKYIPSHFEQYIKWRGDWYEMPYWGNIYVLSRISCMIGINYQNNVNNARENEGLPRTFQTSGEPWGPNFGHTNAAVLQHRTDPTRRYLQVRIQSRTYDYRRLDNNHRIPMEEIEEFLKPESNKHGVVLRRFKFSSLQQVVMRKNSEQRSKRYIVTA